MDCPLYYNRSKEIGGYMVKEKYSIIMKIVTLIDQIKLCIDDKVRPGNTKGTVEDADDLNLPTSSQAPTSQCCQSSHSSV